MLQTGRGAGVFNDGDVVFAHSPKTRLEVRHGEAELDQAELGVRGCVCDVVGGVLPP